jgi:hypothetical protein
MAKLPAAQVSINRRPIDRYPGGEAVDDDRELWSV